MDTTAAPPALPASRDLDRSLFTQTMAYVALTAALFAVGAYVGRGLHGLTGLLFFIGAFACLMGLQSARGRSLEATVALLCGFGVLMGFAVAPTLAYYANVNPSALWLSAAATALFVAGCGAFGNATRHDLSALARMFSWALLALIGFGVVLIFVQVPNGALIYSVLGLVVFAGLTAYDFQRLRRASEEPTDRGTAVLIAASIFLDVLNVFLLFLQLFSWSSRD
jgi:FtsH-binding integral membrane protein